MHSGKHLWGWLIVLMVGGSLGLSSTVRSAERYTLVLKDGRRIEISAYEEADGQLFYYRYDARIGIARDKIAKIITNTPADISVPLEDEITGRIAREHGIRFSLSDFLREDYLAAEITPRLSPKEQQAYVHKLLALKKAAIFEIDDLRQVAERNGDVVEIARLEKRLVHALDDWALGQEVLAQIARRQGPGKTMDEPQAPATPNAGRAAPSATGASNALPDAAYDESAAALTGIERLHQRRDMLRLVIYKHYPSVQHQGGFLTRRKAEEELRIVELQIQFFDRLAPLPPPSAPSASEVGSSVPIAPVE